MKKDIWKEVYELLNRAILHIPNDNLDITIEGHAIRERLGQAREYLSHNELGLAFEELEETSAQFKVSDSFEHSMIEAAKLMGLSYKGTTYAKNL